MGQVLRGKLMIVVEVLLAMPLSMAQHTDARAAAHDDDSVRVDSVRPPLGAVLKTGQQAEFAFGLSYTLVSRNQADLVVSLGQFVDSPVQCQSEKGSLVASSRVTVKRGKGKAIVRVIWKGSPSSSAPGPSGYLAPAPSLWETDRHSRIKYFGIDTKYCFHYAR